MTYSEFIALKQAFEKEEDGAATPLAIFFCLIFIVMGGLAVDYHKAVSEYTEMQVAADTAAHAALYTREFESREDSVDMAMLTISNMLPDLQFGDAIINSDVEFGVWDPDTEQFTVDESSVTSVRVWAEMEPSRGNTSRTMLLRMIGFDEFTLRTNAVYDTYYPPCFNEGFVAEDIVDLQSGNSYYENFCIHSNTYVSLNQNNYFDPGTVVSMPDKLDLDIPTSGWEQNEGLREAVRHGKYRVRLLAQMEGIINAMYTGATRWGEMEYVSMAGITSTATPIYPFEEKTTGNGKNSTTSWVSMGPSDTGKKTFTPDSFQVKNVIYRADCSGNGDITFSPGVYEGFALVTNCAINFNSSNAAGNSVKLQDVIIATTNEDDRSMDSSILQLGDNDTCTEGGGVLLMTMGGVKVSSSLSAYGAQILAKKDITFSANASGIEGVSFVSGGVISGTSNSSMGFCEGHGTDKFLKTPYFRMVN